MRTTKIYSLITTRNKQRSCSLGDFLANQRIRLFLKVANYSGYFCYEIYFDWVTKSGQKVEHLVQGRSHWLRTCSKLLKISHLTTTTWAFFKNYRELAKKVQRKYLKTFEGWMKHEKLLLQFYLTVTEFS